MDAKKPHPNYFLQGAFFRVFSAFLFSSPVPIVQTFYGVGFNLWFPKATQGTLRFKMEPPTTLCLFLGTYSFVAKENIKGSSKKDTPLRPGPFPN